MARDEAPLVLLVEDDDATRRLLRNLLERQLACRVIDVATGAQAVEQARAVGPDLVVLDVGLPDVDGVAVLAAIRSDPALQGIPAVAVSAEHQRDVIERMVALGLTDYILKPFDVFAVERRLQRVLDGLPRN